MNATLPSVGFLSLPILFLATGAYAAEIAAPSAPPVDTKSKIKIEPARPVQVTSGEKIVYNPPASPQSRIVYLPPKRGAPNVRVTGASRTRSGGLDVEVILCALAPEHTGYTAQESPSLFWYQSQPANARFELTLLDGDKPKATPILSLELDGAQLSGIQRVRLKDHKVTLKPDVEYQWIVAIVVNSTNRSCDIISSAWIKRVSPPEKLEEQLKAANQERKAIVYANQGLWYDALEILSDDIEARPKENGSREMRGDLLKQVGLNHASKHDSVLLKSTANQVSTAPK